MGGAPDDDHGHYGLGGSPAIATVMLWEEDLRCQMSEISQETPDASGENAFYPVPVPDI